MTKANAAKRDTHLMKIQGLMSEVTREIHQYQEAFANDGFMHSVDEYASSLVGALLTSRGILGAVMGTTEAAAEEEPLGGFVRADLDMENLRDGLLQAAQRIRPAR